MAYSFANIPRATPPRSVFRRNHNIKTTINTDFLYPIYVDECLPGDVFKFKQHIFARLSTPLTPVMDNLYLDTFFFAVPVRLVDKEFKRLMGERPFGDVRNDYTVPQLAVTPKSGSLSDYLGLPLLPDGKSVSICPWWHRAYNLVYNEFFRDENLCPARPIAGLHEDGSQTTEAESDYILCRRGKRKDYYTGSLPWPQKGEAAGLPVNFAGATVGVPRTEGIFTWNSGIDGQSAESVGIGMTPTYPTSGTASKAAYIIPNADWSELKAGNASRLGVEFPYTEATISFPQTAQVTINQLRESVAIQHLLETDARGGTRYVELIRAHFNVVSPDARQQRPEYLGGTSQPLNVTTVAQTSSSTDNSPQGNLAAFVTANSNAYWTKTFTEHTVIIGLANVRADLSYQQGVPRMFSRRTKYDFYWPELANLGEQAVLNKEIYAQGTADDNETFGYQERWAEYRYHPNTITGQFRSTAPQTLDYWHLAQKFESLPTLSQEFIEEHVPIDRVLAVSTSVAPNMILDGWFELETARLMPLYSVPGLGRL